MKSMLSLLALVVAGGGAPCAVAAEPPPNIVFLLTDDQRWDTLGAAGNPIVQTPQLDRLAERGVLFDDMFVSTSICSVSRASIMTGQYARRHGIWDFETGLSEQQLANSYFGRLKAEGYHMGFVGKWGVGEPLKDYFDYDRAFPGWGDYAIEVDGESRHLTSVMGDQSIEFLETAPGDRPFCLSVSFKAPHVQDSYDLGDVPFPYDPELAHLYEDMVMPEPAAALPAFFERLPGFLQDSESRLRWAVRFWGPSRYQESIKGYYRLISGVDRVVGRLVAALEKKGLADNTVIVFSGDNGFYLGEYGLAGKWFAHEASIRVPLLIYDPRLPEEHRGRRATGLALNIDLAPTMLALAGIEPSPDMQGRSLVPLMHGRTEGWREAFFYEHLFEHPRIPPSEAVRTESWKYVRYTHSQPLFEELYDLAKDPQELDNLATVDGYEATLARMRESWAQWRRRVQ